VIPPENFTELLGAKRSVIVAEATAENLIPSGLLNALI
jgi:hypothetical protein